MAGKMECNNPFNHPNHSIGNGLFIASQKALATFPALKPGNLVCKQCINEMKPFLDLKKVSVVDGNGQPVRVNTKSRRFVLSLISEYEKFNEVHLRNEDALSEANASNPNRKISNIVALYSDYKEKCDAAKNEKWNQSNSSEKCECYLHKNLNIAMSKFEY